MKTGSWKTYKGPGRIGICVGNPRGAPGGFRFYRPLAPTREMLSMSHEEYAPVYQAILDRLDPVECYDTIHILADGAEPVLMCFEVAPFTETNFCHRRMAADWFEKEMGIVVPEWEPEAAQSFFAI